MRDPASLVPVPGLGSMLLCLCVVSQTGSGNHNPPNPDQDPHPSLPEATRFSSSHVDKLTSPSDRSQSIRTLLQPRLETVLSYTNYHNYIVSSNLKNH